jgi:hypothetical protein
MKLLSRERTAILNSVGAGVVPAIGLHHIQVGRKQECEALLSDLDNIENAGVAVRFVMGPFGVGKSFFINLVRTVALQKKFVVLRADITPQRRLHGTKHQARSLYSELMRNLATRSRPEGGALAQLVERWVGDVAHQVTSAGGELVDVQNRLIELCKPLQDMVAGFDFCEVLGQYYRGFLDKNDVLQESAMRWLRAEYSTKTEAREDLGVRRIIDDASIYDYLKLFAAFVRVAGYSGLLVCIDELVVLSHRLNNRTARNNNFEAILRIVNDCLQGSVEGLGFLFAATDDCILDRRRGLSSYEALATRLAPNRFADDDLIDLSGPLLRLPPLTPEDCYVLLTKLRWVHSGGNEDKFRLPDQGIEAYLEDCGRRLGAQYFQTPREITKDFIGLLNILEQNPDSDWRSILGQVDTAPIDMRDPSEIAAQAHGDDDDEDDDGNVDENIDVEDNETVTDPTPKDQAPDATDDDTAPADDPVEDQSDDGESRDSDLASFRL